MEKSIHQASDAFLAEVSHRFQVVSRIAVLIKQDYKLADAVHTAASAHFLDADGSWRKNSVRTLYRWYSAFSAGGIEALKPQERQRNKPSSVISDNLLNFFKELKENDPVVSIPDMIRQGEYQHMITPQDKPDRTTLWRTLNRLGVDTGRSRTVKKKRDARRFAYPHRMDMMICDGNHFRAGAKKLKRVALFFLDDATRMGLGVWVATSETTESFLRGLFETLLKYGSPTALFMDNGSGFKSGDAHTVLSQLEIPFIHGTPRYPEGRGYVQQIVMLSSAVIP